MPRERPKKPRPKLPVSTEERFLDYFKERLIKLVYEHPCIWHENGKVKIFRQSILGHSKTIESWQEIALALKTPMNVCQGRWHGLCQSFLLERKKRVEGTNQKHQFKHYDSMLFLVDETECPPSALEQQSMPVLNLAVPDKLKEITCARRKFKLDLIEQVRFYKNLWNPSLPSFYDDDLAKDCWAKIATRLDTNPDKCQTTFSILRNAYFNNFKKSNNPHIWEYYNSLRFLDDSTFEETVNNVRQLAEDIPSTSHDDLPAAPIKFEHRLIEQVRLHENLWDMSLSSYTDQIVRRQSWRHIAKMLKTTAKKCQTAFDILRDDYFQIYSMQPNPDWEFYDSLRFLDSISDLYQTWLSGTSESAPKDALSVSCQPILVNPKVLVSTKSSTQNLPVVDVPQLPPILDRMPKLEPVAPEIGSELASKFPAITPPLAGSDKPVIVHPAKRIKLEDIMSPDFYDTANGHVMQQAVQQLLCPADTFPAAGFIKIEPAD